MQASEHTCPKCKAEMERGFIVDQTYGGRLVSKWIEGTPEKSIWFGINLKGKRSMELAAYRCASCGYIESYAN